MRLCSLRDEQFTYPLRRLRLRLPPRLLPYHRRPLPPLERRDLLTGLEGWRTPRSGFLTLAVLSVVSLPIARVRLRGSTCDQIWVRVSTTVFQPTVAPRPREMIDQS